MISPDEFVARWHGSELSKADKDFLATVPISERSKKFLIQAGLPEKTFVDADFAFNLSAPALKYFDENMVEALKDGDSKRYLQIGKQLSSLICIDLKNEEIYILRTKIKKIEFVCSGVIQLAELLLIFDEVYDRFREGQINRKNKKEIRALVKSLIETMSEIDSKALSTETVWSEMLEVIKSVD